GNANNSLSSILLANYSTHDLEGDWYISSLQCGGEGGCYAFFGGMDISETGLVRQWYGEEFESDDMPTQIYIDSNGLVEIDNEDSFIGFMSPDKKTVTATITDDVGNDTAQIIVLQKRGENVDFVQSDLAGEWDMHSFDCDSGGYCGWERGEANITPGGFMTWTSFVDSDEGEAEEEIQDSYLVSINWTDEEENYWNGVVTIKEFYDEGNPIVFGAMSQSKNVVVGVVENDRNDSQIIILQKKNGVVFSQADLAGLWSMHGLRCNEYEGSEYVGVSLPVIVIEGEMSIIESEIPVGIVSITDTGIVSLEGEGISLTDGTMSLDKEMIVINGSFAENTYEFFIFQRIRDVSPVQSLANTVSGFADTALNIIHDDWDVIFAAQQRAGRYTIDDAGEIVFRDLGSFMQGVSEYAKSDTIFQYAYDAKEAFDQCIIANHGSSTDNGLSIYSPRWWWDEVGANYIGANLSFLLGNGYTQYWDNFLGDYVDTDLIRDPNLTGEATFSRTITGGTTASAYVMISSPLWSGVLDPLADNLGDYDTELWRAFMWDTELGSYDEYPFDDFGDYVVEGKLARAEYNYMDPGYGLWLISRNDATLSITGSMEDYYDEPYDEGICLEPGWNQIGTPFNFDIDWDTVDVVYYDEGIEGYVICDVSSDENTVTSHTLWRYLNGSYSGTGVMRRGESYWLNNLTEDDVWLLINPVRTTIPNSFVPSLERTLTLFAKVSGEEMPPPPPGGTGSESESGEEGSGGGSGCFIATACFGSPMSGEVNILKNFRDRYLLSNPIGKVFVSTYYRYSPKVADFIAKHDFLKVLVRSTLYPVVEGCGVVVEK
ncbi:hypothetical protein KAS42_02730, partial [bacterium]|nr:hypothetical protein [bacterium]